MSRRWLRANRPFIIRDLVRDYCQVCHVVREQHGRFLRDGSVSYATLRDLLGEARRKGVFWRLKDAAHHIFRSEAGPGVAPEGSPSCVGALIDWCIGHAFHECAKLREDAFQGRHYGNRLRQIAALPDWEDALGEPLGGLAGQTAESCSRELGRIMRVLSHGLSLLPRLAALEGENSSLARWLVCEEAFARGLMGGVYDDLVSALCRGDGRRLYTLAARDLARAGRLGQARGVLAMAGARGGLDDDGAALLQDLAVMLKDEPDGNAGPAREGVEA